MHTASDKIIELIRNIVPLLEQSDIGYWLGRGVLRHWMIKNEVGDQQSDLDFHIWAQDKDKVRDLFKGREDYKVQNKEYKLAFIDKSQVGQTEFMLLRKDSNYPQLVYHERKNGRFYFPAECVASFDYIKIAETKIRIPQQVDKYLLGIYGPNWHKEGKDDKNNNPFKNRPDEFVKFLNK